MGRLELELSGLILLVGMRPRAPGRESHAAATEDQGRSFASENRCRTMNSPRRSCSGVAMIAVGILLGSPSLGEEQTPTATIAAVVRPATPPHKPLDLRPPDITHLYTSEQLNMILAATFMRENIEEVEVERERDRMPNTPTPWPGIAAPFWALLNPTQSWRIFAPLPPDQTRGLRYVRANATDEYVLEPAGVPSPHAQ